MARLSAELAVAKRRCSSCGEPPGELSHTQLPLLRGGDYGEAVQVTLAVCCGVHPIRVEAVTPR